MIRRVKKVSYESDYKLRIRFDNGVTKIVDLAAMLKDAKNLFEDLKNIDYFKLVECDGFSICWPNGIDVCPDLLYKTGKTVSRTGKQRRASSKPRSRKRPASRLK